MGQIDLHEQLYPWFRKQGILWETGQPDSRDEQGNPYVTLCIGGVKPEGEDVKLFYTSASNEMTEHFKESLLQFLDGRKHIVWRMFPAIQHEAYKDDFTGEICHRCQIRCRLTAYPL